MVEKADMSLVGGDGSREAGTGIGLATSAGQKTGEAAFLDAAAGQLDALSGLEPEEEPRKRRKPVIKEPVDVELEEQDGLEDVQEDDEADEAPEEDDGDEGPVSEEYEEDDEEEDAKVSLRLNGKKASLEEILDHVGATVVVNGKDVDVSGSELIKGYMKGKDYSDKTTELKRSMDEMMPYNQMVAYAKQDPQFLDHVQNYFQNGPYPELTANPMLKTSDGDLAKMLDRNDSAYDPDKAQQVVQLRSDWVSKNADRRQINARAQQDAQQRYAQWTSEQVNHAQQIINKIGMDMGNEYKDGESEYSVKSAQVLDYLRSSGYNDQEISGQAQISASDARAAITAYKASEYDRMMRESDAPRVTLGKKRKRLAPPRSQNAGSGTRTTTSKRQQRDTFRKASKEQTTDSWVTAIENRLNRR